MSFNQFIRALPLFILLLICLLLATGLFSPSTKIKHSRIIGKPVAAIDLPVFGDNRKSMLTQEWAGKVVVVNFFASWCIPCAQENKLLMDLANTRKVAIYGIAWRDTPDKLAKWLQKYGNPYQVIAEDRSGSSTVAFSLSGVPETFVIDKSNIIRFHYAGELTSDIVQQEILPLVEQLNQQQVRP